MLFVTHKTDGCHPVVRCYVCDKNVLGVDGAVVVYERVAEGETLRVVIAHPGSCQAVVMRTLENALGPPHSLDLRDYLGRLAEARAVTC